MALRIFLLLMLEHTHIPVIQQMHHLRISSYSIWGIMFKYFIILNHLMVITIIEVESININILQMKDLRSRELGMLPRITQLIG